MKLFSFNNIKSPKKGRPYWAKLFKQIHYVFF